MLPGDRAGADTWAVHKISERVISSVESRTHLSGVEDVGVVGAVNALLALGGLERHLESGHGHVAGLEGGRLAGGLHGEATGGEDGLARGNGGERDGGHLCVAGMNSRGVRARGMTIKQSAFGEKMA